MNFYYDPILGLQYTYLGDLFLINIDSIPQNFEFDAEQWIKYIRETGVQPITPSEYPIIERVLNITEYRL